MTREPSPARNGSPPGAEHSSAVLPENSIRAIFFDAEHALRVTVRDRPFISQAESSLMNLLQTRESHEILFSRLEMRASEYLRQAEESMLEVSESELWSRYLLPEYEPNTIYANAPRLARLWLDREGRRTARPDAVETVRELSRRGYVLGLLANTTSETEIPDWLVTEGLADCFRATLLSAKVRLRMPDPALFHLACRCLGAAEGQCAYVGGGDARDTAGARRAGFGLTVLLDAPDLPGACRNPADARERAAASLRSLLDIFPPLE